jgi:hypothetical protein
LFFQIRISNGYASLQKYLASKITNETKVHRGLSKALELKEVSMSDPFLSATKVSTDSAAMTETLKSALQQRQNKVYSRSEVGNERLIFRLELAKMMREESQRYICGTQLVSDEEHCKAIRCISDNLSARYAEILKNGRFRYGTSQKALTSTLNSFGGWACWAMDNRLTVPSMPSS